MSISRLEPGQIFEIPVSSRVGKHSRPSTVSPRKQAINDARNYKIIMRPYLQRMNAVNKSFLSPGESPQTKIKVQTLKTILKKVGNAFVWAYNNSAEWGTVSLSFLAIYALVRGNYFQCAILIGFAILCALWDIRKARIANPVGIKLKYWVKMRRNCIEFGLRTVNKQGYLHATPEQDVIEIADKYFNYMLSGKVPPKEEEATK